uniref:Uncharacterized protein n=1 Tax=Parascaris equorum TaxID=6256 RepID=A0A914RZI3_PAREQ
MSQFRQILPVGKKMKEKIWIESPEWPVDHRNGIHVRPRRAHLYEGQKGRSMLHFERLELALRFLEARPDREKLIFLHTDG